MLKKVVAAGLLGGVVLIVWTFWSTGSSDSTTGST